MRSDPTVLLIGGSGMLGSDVLAECSARGWPVHAPSRAELDIADPSSVAQVAAGIWAADVCVNCAAYTAVDGAEEEPDRAMEINGLGPSYLARACAMAGVPLLHIGTDFVFDGRATEPYREDDEVAPLGAYGRSKAAGEEAVLAAGPHWVVRTSWLYGPAGRCFPEVIVRAWLAGKPLRVVTDQVGTPTFTRDLARTLADVVAANPMPGIYHAAGPEAVSWHAFAMAAVESYARVCLAGGEVPEIEAISTSDWPTRAPRPAFSALGTARLRELGIEPMRPLREALDEYWRLRGTVEEGR